MSQPTASFGFTDVAASEKPRLVRGVFDRVAKRYDLMNDLMSVGVHRLWKDAVASRLNPQPGEVIIDCAGGTGDMARRFAKMVQAAQVRRGGEDAQIIVMDYNGEMVAAGRERGGDPQIVWSVGDAQHLPLKDASADAYSISFGIRNVTDILAALKEARRVLKPGGKLLVLEFSKVAPPLQKVYDWYSFKVLPRLGQWVAGDDASYRYLAESIRMHPDQQTLKTMMHKGGFGHVDYHNLTGGVVALHVGIKC